MSKTKKTTKKLPSQVTIIKTIRREIAPRGKTILSKKEIPFRKRKHKKLDID